MCGHVRDWELLLLAWSSDWRSDDVLIEFTYHLVLFFLFHWRSSLEPPGPMDQLACWKEAALLQFIISYVVDLSWWSFVLGSKIEKKKRQLGVTAALLGWHTCMHMLSFLSQALLGRSNPVGVFVIGPGDTTRSLLYTAASPNNGRWLVLLLLWRHCCHCMR